MTQGLLDGRYQIVRELGRGGAGTVYLCQDLRLRGSTWAVKEVIHGEGMEAFEREASMLASLKHSGLPIVVDFFVHQDRYYLVQEYVDGPTIAEYVEEMGPVHPRLAMEWGLELAEILDYLHCQQPAVLHNDLKPKNVVCTNAGLKLIDFGLARFKLEETVSARASGSLSFSPPEQWQGSYTEKADIYSWGATLYYLLSGHPPSPIPGEHRIRNRRPEVEVEAERLILSCMDPNPDKRPASTADMVQSLQFLLCKMPTPHGSYRPERVMSPAQPPLRTPAPKRSRFVVLAALSFFVLLLGGLAAIHRPPPPVSEPGSPEWPTSLRKASAALNRSQYDEALKLLEGQPGDLPLANVLKADAELLRERPAGLVRVPVLLPITGEYHEAGEWMLQGLSIAQNHLRTAGQPTVYDLWDNRSEGGECLARMQAFTADPNVAAVIGPFGSQNLLLVAPLCNVARLPVVAPSANDPRIAEAGPYVYAVSHSQKARVRAIIKALEERKLHRGVIFQYESGFIFSSSSDLLESSVKYTGGDILQRVRYANEPERAVADWTKRDCDFVFVADNRGAVMGRLVQALRRSGYKGVIGTMGHVGSADFLKLAGADAEGVLFATPFNPESNDPSVVHFMQSFREKYPKIPLSPMCAVTYDTAMLVAEAFKGGANRDQVHDYLTAIGHTTPEYKGISGQFRPSLHGVDNQDADTGDYSVLVVIKNGEYRVANGH